MAVRRRSDSALRSKLRSSLKYLSEAPRPRSSSTSTRITRTARRDATRRDNNMRAVLIHVTADAIVSALVIVGCWRKLLACFGWTRSRASWSPPSSRPGPTV